MPIIVANHFYFGYSKYWLNVIINNFFYNLSDILY